MTVSVTAIPMLTDNYSWLIRGSEAGIYGIVDPAEAAPAIAAIDAAAGKLAFIFLTHHHGDHIDGAPELAAKYGAKIVGNAGDAHRLPKLDIAVREGDKVQFGAASARVIDTPGHTLGPYRLLFCRWRAAVLRRHDVQHGLRPAVRGHRRGHV